MHVRKSGVYTRRGHDRRPPVPAASVARVTRAMSLNKELYGGAAKNARRAELKRRGLVHEQVEERVRGVGHTGEPFFTETGPTGQPLGDLPERFTLHVSHGEDARAQLLAYHQERCHGQPNTAEGWNQAKADGWHAPQQAMALAGRNQQQGVQCNLVVSVSDPEGLVGLLAVGHSADECNVMAVHVAPRALGPARISEHLWKATVPCLHQLAAAYSAASSTDSLLS